MSRTSLLCLSFLAAAGSLAAQPRPQPRPAPAPMVGIWEGAYQSEMVPPGTLKLSVARNAGGEWQVTLEIFSDQPPAAGPVREFKVEGDKVSWAQEVSEMNCLSSGVAAGGVLKGNAECWQNGAVVVTASFLLEKKG